jgi:hypothetical protein
LEFFWWLKKKLKDKDKTNEEDNPKNDDNPDITPEKKDSIINNNQENISNTQNNDHNIISTPNEKKDNQENSNDSNIYINESFISLKPDKITNSNSSLISHKREREPSNKKRIFHLRRRKMLQMTPMKMMKRN